LAKRLGYDDVERLSSRYDGGAERDAVLAGSLLDEIANTKRFSHDKTDAEIGSAVTADDRSSPSRTTFHTAAAPQQGTAIAGVPHPDRNGCAPRSRPEDAARAP